MHELRARFEARTVGDLARAIGGDARGVDGALARGVSAIDAPVAGTIAPCTSARWVRHARAARDAGAVLLVSQAIAQRPELADLASWTHPEADVALASLLDMCGQEGASPVVGVGCMIHPSALIAHGVAIGDRVRIGPGCVVGQPGFGFVRAGGRVRAVPQLGGVVIEDDVWLGSLVTIDAGTLAPTRLRARVKIDSQVHVAHNCDIGEDAVVCGMTGLAGSVRVGRGVIIGGGVGIGDHIAIGDGARIAGGSGVIGDVPAGGEYAGYPAMPRLKWLRAVARGAAAERIGARRRDVT